MAAPYEYDYINYETSLANPSTMHAKNTGLARFFRRYLIQKVFSRFTFDLPDDWAKNYFEYVLFMNGHIAILETSKYGVIPQYCTLGGYDVFYQPTRAIIANPAFRKTYELKIGSQTEIIKICPDYGGIYDLVSFYADLLALTAEGFGINILNSKLAYVFGAKNKAGAESLKKMFDQIASGEPASFVDKELLDDEGKATWQYFAQNLQQNFIAPDMLLTMRQIEQEFDTVIGIPNANTDKRERLIKDEVNANNIETYSRCNLWLNMIRDGMDKANNMFGLNLSAELSEMKGDETAYASDIINPRTV